MVPVRFYNGKNLSDSIQLAYNGLIMNCKFGSWIACFVHYSNGDMKNWHKVCYPYDLNTGLLRVRYQFVNVSWFYWPVIFFLFVSAKYPTSSFNQTPTTSVAAKCISDPDLVSLVVLLRLIVKTSSVSFSRCVKTTNKQW